MTGCAGTGYRKKKNLSGILVPVGPKQVYCGPETSYWINGDGGYPSYETRKLYAKLREEYGLNDHPPVPENRPVRGRKRAMAEEG